VEIQINPQQRMLNIQPAVVAAVAAVVVIAQDLETEDQEL
jgi:hypothetical protein